MASGAVYQAKAALRKHLKQKLAAMTEQSRQAQSEAVARKVCLFHTWSQS